MSVAISSHGTLVTRNGVAIGEQRDITSPDHRRATFNTSNQNDADSSYIVGMRDKGPMTIALNYLPSGDVTHAASVTAGLMNAWVTGAKDLYKITYPDTSSEMFSGFLTNMPITAPVDGPLGATITVQPTGASVFVNT